jgi:hypothetical protein
VQKIKKVYAKLQSNPAAYEKDITAFYDYLLENRLTNP